MSIPSWAYRGAKVACTRAPQSRSAAALFCPEPVAHGVYTVLVAELWAGEPVIELVEFPDSLFRADLFRPLITQSDDISAHFQHHLSNPVREEV